MIALLLSTPAFSLPLVHEIFLCSDDIVYLCGFCQNHSLTLSSHWNQQRWKPEGEGVLSNCSEEKFWKFKNHHLQLPYLHSTWQILLSCNLCLKLIKHCLPPFLTHCSCCSSLALPSDKWQQSNEMQLKWKPKGMYILSFNLLRWPHDLSTIISILQMRNWGSECLELTAAKQWT